MPATKEKHMAELLAELGEALASNDPDRMAPYLAPDVRWGGDEETETTCHNATEVLRFLRMQRAYGLEVVEVRSVQPAGEAVIVDLLAKRPGGPPEPEPRYLVLRLADGKVTDIRGFPTEDEALASATG
jgi:hypothetical protein